MPEAQVIDFAGFSSRSILKRTKAFYALRAGGFMVSTGGGLACMIWGVATGDLETAFGGMLVCVLLGLVAFVLSVRSRADCTGCGKALDVYHCAEERPTGKHSGHLYVCRHCRAYEARLNLEFD